MNFCFVLAFLILLVFVCLIWFCLFVFVRLFSCLFLKDKEEKNIKIVGQTGREDLGGVG